MANVAYAQKAKNWQIQKWEEMNQALDAVEAHSGILERARIEKRYPLAQRKISDLHVDVIAECKKLLPPSVLAALGYIKALPLIPPPTPPALLLAPPAEQLLIAAESQSTLAIRAAWAKRASARQSRAYIAARRKTAQVKARNSGEYMPVAKSAGDTLVLANGGGVWLGRDPYYAKLLPAANKIDCVIYAVGKGQILRLNDFPESIQGAVTLANTHYLVSWEMRSTKLILTKAGRAIFEAITASPTREADAIKALSQAKMTTPPQLPDFRLVQYRGGSNITALRDARDAAQKLYEAKKWDGSSWVIVENPTLIIAAMNRGMGIDEALQGAEGGTAVFKPSKEMALKVQEKIVKPRRGGVWGQLNGAA